MLTPPKHTKYFSTKFSPKLNPNIHPTQTLTREKSRNQIIIQLYCYSQTLVSVGEFGEFGEPWELAMGQTSRTIRDLNTTLLPKTLRQWVYGFPLLYILCFLHS